MKSPLPALVLLLLTLRAACGQTYTFSTVAGATTQAGAVDGTAVNARFRTPYGVATDAAGNLYVSDHFNHAIRKISVDGVVTTLAGQPGTAGFANGTGAEARFNRPCQIALDRTGNVYVADFGNNRVRHITPAGVVTTFAGGGTNATTTGPAANALFGNPTGVAFDAEGNLYVSDWIACNVRKISTAGIISLLAGGIGAPGAVDGLGGAARFQGPESITVDPAGNVYVADFFNHTIRKVSPAGAVTTLAGLAGSAGLADGAGRDARFSNPRGIAVDAAGNVFVADSTRAAVRKISPAGVVTTLNGGSGTTDGIGREARFGSAHGVTVDATGVLYVTDGVNQTLRRGVPDSAPQISPRALTLAPGAQARFAVEATSAGQRFQWRKNRAEIAGATGSTFTLTNLQAGDSATYTAVLTDDAGAITSAPAILAVDSDAARLVNLSTRTRTGAGDQVLTLGFSIGGSGEKSLLIRGVGPALAAFGVGATLPDPRLEVFDGGASVATNDDWMIPATSAASLAGAFAQAGAFALPAASKDAALSRTFAAKSYTVQVSGTTGGASGVALAEIYDLDRANAGGRLVNLSARCELGTGENGLTAGFVIAGTGSLTMLIRAIGPTLANFGVGGVAPAPAVVIKAQGSATVLAVNTEWNSVLTPPATFAEVGAFALPVGSRDAAIIITLAAGGYTGEAQRGQTLHFALGQRRERDR